MSAVFWIGVVLLTTAFCGLLFAAWYGLRGRRGRGRNGGSMSGRP